MEVFARQDAVLCGIDEAKILLAHALEGAAPGEADVEALDDGDAIAPKEVVLRIRARYRQFGLYETAVLGLMSQSTGWATAARECVEEAAPQPVISFGARHVHPDVTDNLDYSAIVGGCVGASTPAGARLAGLRPTGTMPHSLVLIFGDTVKAAEAFDRDLGPEVPRIVLVDTFRDEAEEALRVAHALGDRLYGIRLDTPSERGRVTADLVHEVRARLDQAGFDKVKIIVSGGLDPDRIRYLQGAGCAGRFLRRRLLHQRCPAGRLHGRPQGDRRQSDRQARPHPRPDPEPASAADRSRRLAGALGGPTVRPDDEPEAPSPDDADAASTPWPNVSRLTACSSAARHSWPAATMPRRPSSSSAPDASSPARARSSSRSPVPTTTAAASREAAEAFAQLIEIDPSAAYGHFGLGQALKRLGRRDEARRHLRIAVALAPGSRLYRSALERLG